MSERILLNYDEQNAPYNPERETKDKMEISVYPKLDFSNFFGILTLDRQPVRTEIYHRKTFGDAECFCLEGMTDDEISANISQR